MEINEEKRNKFMEYAGKRVNNVLHDMQILEPMARSNSYDFTKEDVEEMFGAMQSTLNDVRAEFNKKFEEKDVCMFNKICPCGGCEGLHGNERTKTLPASKWCHK